MNNKEVPAGQEEEIEAQNVNENLEENKGEQESATTMETLLEEEGLELDFPKKGEIRKGVIASIKPTEIFVSVGAKSEGIISGKEFEQIPTEERQALEVGQEIPVFILSTDNKSGYVVLSYNRAREEQDWEEVEALKESGGAYESTIIGYNKGGLIVPIGKLRGFVPASQVSSLRRVSFADGETPEQRWGSMVGETISVCVIEVDRSRRRLILSEKLALSETRETLKDRLLDELQEGDVRKGRVTSLADFGAFVNIDGADGLVHLSEVSWERIKHPKEVLHIGQEVDVKVISIDREKKRIGLSIRQLQEDPWIKKVAHLKEGMLVEGTITHIANFGAFAKIEDDLEGLIHVSELSSQRVEHPKEVVHEGEVLTLRIIKIDQDRHRIGLSLRKVDSPAYADFDWKMALADEVVTVKTEEAEEAVEEAAEAVEVAEQAEAAQEVAEELAEVAQVEAEIESAEAVEAIADAEEAKEEAAEAVVTAVVAEEIAEIEGEEADEAVEVAAVAEELVEEALEAGDETVAEMAEEVAEAAEEKAEKEVAEAVEAAAVAEVAKEVAEEAIAEAVEAEAVAEEEVEEAVEAIEDAVVAQEIAEVVEEVKEEAETEAAEAVVEAAVEVEEAEEVEEAIESEENDEEG